MIDWNDNAIGKVTPVPLVDQLKNYRHRAAAPDTEEMLDLMETAAAEIEYLRSH